MLQNLSPVESPSSSGGRSFGSPGSDSKANACETITLREISIDIRFMNDVINLEENASGTTTTQKIAARLIVANPTNPVKEAWSQFTERILINCILFF